MSENSSLLFHWKKQKKRVQDETIDRVVMREGGLSEVLNSIELEKSSFGAISFRLYCFVSISNKLKRIGTDCGSCFEVFLAALTLSLELFRPEGEEVEPLYGPKILSQSEDFIFPRKKEETSFWR